MATELGELTGEEAGLREGCEQVIRKGLATFAEVGAALMEIRDRRLYRSTHGSFEAYCKATWRFDRTYASRLITASEVAGTVAHGHRIPPKLTERAARELKELPAEKRARAYEKADKGADGKPTDDGARAAVCQKCGQRIIICQTAKMAGRRFLRSFGDEIVLSEVDYMPHPCPYSIAGRTHAKEPAEPAGGQLHLPFPPALVRSLQRKAEERGVAESSMAGVVPAAVTQIQTARHVATRDVSGPHSDEKAWPIGAARHQEAPL